MNTEQDNGAIQIENCRFAYKGQNQNTIDIKNLKIYKGEKVFLYGPSGHGKSTLLNLIAGVLTSNEGNIIVLGSDLKKLSQGKRDKIRGEKIGYIFQIFNLIPYLSVLDNIILPSLINKKRSHNNIHQEAMELVNALGLTKLLSQAVSELSIGQQQRVACARALIGQPEIIIADEPTSALDEKNNEEFMSLLMNQWEKKKFTLLFVSHDERLKVYFDRTISLPEINHV